jgi:KaiC/GvpD/RAD55 family RecA-like ATPase
MGIKELNSLIARGKDGKNVGISTGKPKLDKVLYGIQRKFLYTIGASSGVGKSSFTLDVFIYNLYMNSNKVPITFLIYSFEMSKEVLQAKLVSRYIWDTFKEVVTYEDILSLSSPISQKHLELYDKSKEWLEEITKLLVIYDKPLTPQAVYGTCKEWLRSTGAFIAIDSHREDYIPKDPDQYKVLIIDHISLLSGPGSKKEKIDLVADYMITFRNKCGITGVFVQQLNRGISSVDRKTNGFELVGLED